MSQYITLITTDFFGFLGSFFDNVDSQESKSKQIMMSETKHCSCLDIFQSILETCHWSDVMDRSFKTIDQNC